MDLVAPKFAGIIAAAGLGARFGGLKQQMVIADKSVLQWSIDALRPHCALIVIAAPSERVAEFQSYETKTIVVVSGGATRVASIVNAFVKISAAFTNVLIHDAARPAVPADLIDRVKQAAVEFGAAIPGLPVSDTIKRVRADVIVETVDRSDLWAAQTPQGFRVDWYREVTRNSQLTTQNSKLKTQNYPVTDDASLFEQAGRPVKVVQGSETNLKLTIPGQLRVLENILKS